MAKATGFKTPKGTRDVGPPDSARWQALISAFEREAQLANYGLLHTPIFEDIGVFQRIGEGTDVVQKQMWDFLDKGDRRMVLRPENTASVCRSFVQQRPIVPWKIWYQGPFFRYEEPQAGRQRQFNQLGIEVLGSSDADIDVEAIALGSRFLERIGLKRVLLLINSMGDVETRLKYAQAVQDYLRANLGDIDREDHEKIEAHPLRVLDSKRPNTRKVTAEAPRVEQFLSVEAGAHFDRVQAGLGSLGISFAIEPRLVRGLDYYTHTLFEYQSSALDTAQNALGGGGRYNGLVEELGGPDTPGIGFAMGVERILLACDAEQAFVPPDTAPVVWIIDVTDGSSARDLTHELRSTGVSADRSFDHRSMRSQMKAADRSGAAWAIIVGDQEVASGVVTLRNLRESDDQKTIERSQVVAYLVEVLSQR
ncbi:MAG: histidine--tRNA ligase [Actinomycetia bacterium]|nr:histidine--tRNA ligase [Actinomycetes bacterium]